jgi:phosphoenolpyruvate synthase/pyruvate phosphate dikinase
MTGIPLVLTLDDASAQLSQVGGKGASLARMAAAGLPVPAGFHVTTAAYRRFVTENGLQEQILAAVSGVSAATADSSMRLHTGDRVRVNGEQGTAEVLRTAEAA